MERGVTVQDRLPEHPVRRRIVVASRKDARRARLAAYIEPTDWQENHSPTEDVMVRLTGQKKTSVARRRRSDARLWDAMSSHQQEAAHAIAAQFERITAGTSPKLQQFERVGRTAKGFVEPTVSEVEATEDYWRWAEKVQFAKLSHAAVVDILIMGESCRTVDASRRKRKGWAIENLLDCLDVYCRLQGWPANGVRR